MKKQPNKLRSVATKVVVQMATKLGAVPWGIAMPLKTAMVVGFDTYHDTANNKASFGALIASINPSMTRYTSHISKHETKQVSFSFRSAYTD